MPLMIGPIERFMTEDHVRLDALLARAAPPSGTIDEATYAEFREGLLRHIGMEEKVLLPEMKRLRGGEPMPIAKALRKDHGLIAALLVPPPTHERVERIRAALAAHNPLEEGPEGLYASCDGIAGSEASAIVERLAAQPRVPVAKYYDGPLLREN
jgi:hypothetical protein